MRTQWQLVPDATRIPREENLNTAIWMMCVCVRVLVSMEVNINVQHVQALHHKTALIYIAFPDCSKWNDASRFMTQSKPHRWTDRLVHAPPWFRIVGLAGINKIKQNNACSIHCICGVCMIRYFTCSQKSPFWKKKKKIILSQRFGA